MTIAFFILNIIQAVAEFLPISSSGHLILTEYLFDITENGLEAAIHLPTALAILFVFWATFWNILKDQKRWPAYLAAIIPAGIVGLIFDDYITAIFYSPFVIGLNLIIWGGVFIYMSYRHKDTKSWVHTSWDKIPFKTALFVGLAQVLALIPGTSRSGITTLAGITQGVAPAVSARFSFMIGFPLIFAASILGFAKIFMGEATLITSISPLAVFGGLLLSFLLGIFFMRLFTSRHTLLVLRYSGYYRIILGLLILLWL